MMTFDGAATTPVGQPSSSNTDFRTAVFQAGDTDVMKKRAERFGTLTSTTSATVVTRPVVVVVYAVLHDVILC